MAWVYGGAITGLATLLGIGSGILLLSFVTSLTAIGIPAGQSGHTLALVLFPYVCSLAVALGIALYLAYYRLSIH